MLNHPIANKLLCVAFVAAFMLPLGELIFPYVDDIIGNFQFDAMEAVLSASLGFGIHAAVFG